MVHARLSIRSRRSLIEYIFGPALALLNGLLHLLVENGDIDAEFIAEHTDGWEAMPAFLADYPPAKVAEITGIPERDIRTAARMIADAGEWMSCWTMGLNQSTHGTWNTNALINLHLATGAICQSTSDTEVILHLVARSKKPRMIDRFIDCLRQLEGGKVDERLEDGPGLTQDWRSNEIAASMNVGGHLVDVSPLSTIGALCIASVPSGDMSRKLFNQLLAWGMSMTVAGAVICWVLFA